MTTDPNSPTEADTPLADLIRTSAALADNVLGHVDRLVADVVRDSAAVARESAALHAAAAGQAAAVREAVRSAPRFARIVKEGLRILAAYRLHRGLSQVLAPALLEGRSQRLHADGARRLYQLCVELRGGVLKLGQFLSCRMDLLPAAYVEALGSLQDRVPPVDADAVIERIEAELGAPIDELFSSFEREPMAAASLAQVHAARLPDGTEVAVKVQVPGIDEIIEIDIAALRVLAGACGDLLPGDVATACRELARSLRAELDYEAEAAAASALGACFAGDERVLVPAVIASRSSRRVLTMTRIEGARLTEFLDDCSDDDGAAARDRVLGTLIDVFCAQVLRHGLLHADPHPGNFLVCPDGRLALLDFGCVQRYSDAERRAYAELAAAVLCGDARGAADHLRRLGFRAREADRDGLVELAEVVLEAFRAGVALDELDPAEQLGRALEIARANPVAEIPPGFVMLGRVFGALGGLFMHYRPRLNLAAIIAPHLGAAYAPAPAPAA